MPDISFHENSGFRSTSQDQPRETPLLQAPVSREDAAITECTAEFEMLSPEHRLLLTLAHPEEQRYFAGSADPGSSESLSCLERLLMRERNRRKEGLILRITSTTLLAIGSAYFVSTSSGADSFLGLLVLGISLVVLGFMKSRNPHSRLETAAFEYLLQLDDRRSVGLLLEQRHHVSLADRNRVDEALIQRLPQLGVEEVSQWTSNQHNLLCGILDYLNRDRDTELRLAAISVVDKLTDRSSLGMLYHLAAGEAAARGEQAVRTAAQTCLHDLQSRLDFGHVETIPTYLNKICNLVDNKQTVGSIVDADSLYALIALLPQLTPANYREILAPKDRDHLYSILNTVVFGSYGYDKVKLSREVVRTLERVGDTKAIKALGQIASMDAPTDSEKQLRTEAQEAWRYLKQMVEKEKVSKTLLRASYAPDVQPDELLRAAAPAESATDPGELLRASLPKQESGPITTASLSKALDALRRQSEDDHGL